MGLSPSVWAVTASSPTSEAPGLGSGWTEAWACSSEVDTHLRNAPSSLHSGGRGAGETRAPESEDSPRITGASAAGGNPGAGAPSLGFLGAGAAPAVPGSAGGAAGAAGAGSAEGGAPGTEAANAAAAATALGRARCTPSAAAEPSGRPPGRAAPSVLPYHARGPGPGRPSSQNTMPEGGGGDGGEVPALITDGEPLREEVWALSGGEPEPGRSGARGQGKERIPGRDRG